MADVDIVNYALGLLGDRFIVALTDQTSAARLANSIYAKTRDAVLRAHPWNCAIKRAALTETTAPVFGWLHAFTLPTGCLRVLSINDDQACGRASDDFKEEGATVVTNATGANARFIFQITDPTLFTPIFERAFGTKLAAEMAYAITGSAQIAVAMAGAYDAVLKEARAVDNQEGSPDKMEVSILTDVR